jgi:hypothetical protein
MNPKKTESIQRFLSAVARTDLAALYHAGMEVQVNVAQDGGERCQGEHKGRSWQGYTDGHTTWKPFRIPWNANTSPEYKDSEIQFSLEDHADTIGLSGWDWQSRKSVWVAFDFDAIAGHAEAHTKKLSEAELVEVEEKVNSVPWVNLRYSTSGLGRHLYVFLEDVTTNNRAEHLAVAQAILSQLSGLCSFDFARKVDAQGGNMWVWSRRQGEKGLTCIKPHAEKAKVPPNWQDYVSVTSGRKQRSTPNFLDPQSIDSFNALAARCSRVKLDEQHTQLLGWLRENYGGCSWWDAEHHMLVTHTAVLKKAHGALGLAGHFETLATGAELGADQNCFCFPLLRGGWAVRRYNKGVAEHQLWDQNGKDFTKIYFNRTPDLPTAARLAAGKEALRGGGWVFNSAFDAEKAAEALGVKLNLPKDLAELTKAQTRLSMNKDGRLLVQIDHKGDIDPWGRDGKKLYQYFPIDKAPPAEPESFHLDDFVRHMVSPSGMDAGWAVKAQGEWHGEPLAHVKASLLSMEFSPPEVTNIIGASVVQCWKLVNYPFQPEEPGNREWNKKAAQLRFLPSQKDLDKLEYPTWQSVLTHLGKGLDHAVAESEWAKEHRIEDGAHYLKLWIASLFQRPTLPLPYLFFYGQEKTGKSLFHESLAELMRGGVVKSDQALTNAQGFNGELEGAVLGVVEETDLRKGGVALNRLKEWVTAPEIMIHPKRLQPYMVPSTLHFVQTANSHLFCPVLPGDTRIVVIEVGRLERQIPKPEMMKKLIAEAPDFMAEILATEIPPSGDRLNVPVIRTAEKISVQAGNAAAIDQFLSERCYDAPGYSVKFSKLYEEFVKSMDAGTASVWTVIRFSRELPPRYPKAKLASDGNQKHIGNLSLEPPTERRPAFACRGDYLVREEVLLNGRV